MIEKHQASEIVRTGGTFTVLSDQAIDSLSAEALAVYAYLMRKPDDWVIRVKDVCRRFGWGEKGTVWRRVAKELRATGFLFDVVERRNGVVVNRQMCCSTLPRNGAAEATESLGVENQHPRGNHLLHENQHPSHLGVDFPRCGESTPLHKTEYLQSTPAKGESDGGLATESVGWSARLSYEGGRQ